MKKIKCEPEIVKLDDTGASGGWIGSSKAKNVLLYFHGETCFPNVIPQKERVTEKEEQGAGTSAHLTRSI